MAGSRDVAALLASQTATDWQPLAAPVSSLRAVRLLSDLCSLLSELGRESLYLFLLPSDCRLQLLNFAIEPSFLGSWGLDAFGNIRHRAVYGDSKRSEIYRRKSAA